MLRINKIKIFYSNASHTKYKDSLFEGLPQKITSVRFQLNIIVKVELLDRNKVCNWISTFMREGSRTMILNWKLAVIISNQNRIFSAQI